MMELLFARLPPALCGLALRQLGRFLTGSSLPSVAHEAAVLANAAAWADPAGAAAHRQPDRHHPWVCTGWNPRQGLQHQGGKALGGLLCHDVHVKFRGRPRSCTVGTRVMY